MLEDMRLFATVVENTSLNRAAERLNVTQPALSRRIARLERELGVDLFRRIGKRLELTAAGQLTYEFALELRRFHGEYLQRLNAFKSEEAQLATIGASLTTLQTTLPGLITAMTEKHPNLEIKAVTGKSHEIATLVKERKVDFGIVASSVDDDPAITSVPLFDDSLMLVLPRTHYILERTHLEVADLNGLPMILFAPGTWYRTMTDELFRQYGLKPDVRMEIDSFEAIVRLLSACRAGTLLPKSYLRPQLLEDNELYVVRIKELELAKRTTSLIHGNPGWLPASTRYLIEETIGFFARSAHQARD
ncbi:LysR family transcriptional regulator [Cohnella xylanilytica]|uniref:LysR family transcriptional regulator n=1 Tax=Cohnella xylanilytica TaxID=557555 RepID=A0A841U1H3_9BACL|nr:LysR family transcriptional regulator [Cohnella xylanilytica]MBB6691960.1 LysR family transcriptional regulator [Cohnella xylanilytica]GIO11104.1 LysR family transcriptional regulator [Cohnella xylanilytica]